MTHIREITASEFASVVLKADKPVLVDFWAPWCAPCRGLAPVLERVAAEREHQLEVVKFNTDDDSTVPARYSVSGLPTLLLFVGGEIIARFTGPRSHKRLSDEVDGALSA
jgi:thioredoxin 1